MHMVKGNIVGRNHDAQVISLAGWSRVDFGLLRTAWLVCIGTSGPYYWGLFWFNGADSEIFWHVIDWPVEPKITPIMWSCST
eukprot:4760640-Amphidinium_carterae.1